MTNILNKLTNAFPLWVLLASIASLVHPPAFTWFSGPFITYGLGIIMLGMGLTLSFEDFKAVSKYPKFVLIGVAFQFIIMPCLGWSLGYLFSLPTVFAVGLVLVSCCPGGTASNVICFLARSNVALSVTMTAISTLFAILLTPTLTALLAGSRVDVDAWGLFYNTLRVVLVPVGAGILLNQYLPRLTAIIKPAAPLVAVIAIVMIVASIIGAGKETIIESGLRLIIAVICLHACGFLIGYFGAKLLTKDELASRTISVEVGMQNSGLGAVLARNNFSDPATAIPSAISSLTHCLFGSALAAYWRGRA